LTIQVGHGTQTVYYFPSTETSPTVAVSSGGSFAVASQSPSRSSFRAAEWLGDTSHFSAVSPNLAVFAAEDTSSAAATQIDLTQLLETVWSSYQASGTSADEPLLAVSGDDENEDAMKLAVAALFTDDTELFDEL
jgi:hypothetical protein